jgi:hypothetical protein
VTAVVRDSELAKLALAVIMAAEIAASKGSIAQVSADELDAEPGRRFFSATTDGDDDAIAPAKFGICAALERHPT